MKNKPFSRTVSEAVFDGLEAMLDHLKIDRMVDRLVAINVFQQVLSESLNKEVNTDEKTSK